MIKYEVVLGLEIHLELNTKTKMFSASPIGFAAVPNTLVNENDLGYPGALPTVNRQAVLKAVKLAKALAMQVDLLLRFDRKNYFYPDLPKGFQITQQQYPLGQHGTLQLNDGTTIFINRLHLEEDTAKVFHQDEGTFLDYNRSGNPLVEIVTEPCFKSSLEVAEYIEWIRRLALTLDVSDAKMEQGSMRVDINLSLKPAHHKTLGTKVEIKNLNSISNIVKAIKFEIALQTKTLNNGLKVTQATKRFDEKTNATVVMRQKTDSIDYKYFVEPNILPILINEKILTNLELPELPWVKSQRYLAAQIPALFVEQLLNSADKMWFFDQLVVDDLAEGAKIFFNELVPLANKSSGLMTDLNISPKDFSQLINLLLNQSLSRSDFRQILLDLIADKYTLAIALKQIGSIQNIDEIKLNEIIKGIINQNQSFIETNHDRPERVLKFLIGQVIQITRKSASPQLISELVKKHLNQ